MQSTDFILLDGGQLTVQTEFLPVLRANGLDSFDKIMVLPSDTVMRSVPGRSTVRLALGPHIAYLKRYTPPYYPCWQRLVGIESEAAHEWRMIHTLRQHGFNTAAPVACGQRGLSSFVLTLEVPDGIPADMVFEKLDKSRRRQFIERVADLTRRFHAAGFIHKDYYLSHIFVSGDQLYLIDLQRVLGPGKPHPRWQIKDLSQLAYTAQLAGASRGDLLRFYKWYADKMDRDFIRKVMARVTGLHTRGPKYDVIWDQPGAKP